MCLAVYVASSVELPVSQWDKGAPAFYLDAVPSGDRVRRQFSLPHVYYAGSHEGCGCGFLKDGEAGEELEASQGNYRALAGLVRTARAAGGRVEIYACWEGGQTGRPEFVDSLGADEMEDPTFEFKEQQYVRVT